MKCIVLIIVAIAVCTASILKDHNESDQEVDRYFWFPGDGDGELHLVDTQERVDKAFLNDYAKHPDYTEYCLFTRNNPTTEQLLMNGDEISINDSNFDASKVTIFLSHGWKGDRGTEMNQLLTEALLQNGDVNVIVLDWSRLAKRNYLTARFGTPDVGKGLGQFINWLVTLGVSYERVHLVGFSLGGHVVGNAGRETGGLVRRITALDPAKPLWGRHRLIRSDAQYVEVIHTDTFYYGYSDPCGDADFYANGGYSMPGCYLNLFGCSHRKAYKYMISTVKHNHLLAHECATYNDVGSDTCNGELYSMGNGDLNKSRSGIFRVNTGTSYPY